MPISSPPSFCESQASPRSFATTRWTLVLNSGDERGTARAEQAIEELCRIYWYPIYVFIRRRGVQRDDAEDLTQAFFTRLLEKGTLAAARRERGRFRSFILATLKHFLADERDRRRAIKRGGGRVLSLEWEAADVRYRIEPVDAMTPEKVFERKWALSLIERAIERLGEECRAAGQEHLFACLGPCIGGEGAAVSYARLAESLGMTEGAVKVTVHRLRKRYRQHLREEIAHTVERPDEIEEELRYLKQILDE
ncbi:MAG TPA: sigma-70 family RNA polymerase sigma factor [Candidatus Sumerlaeota bacterium]|mgnify:CR=1 FL=1|nr:sigma-70 family RNA polymerase sigma factor [Candidatus Sumerlaeota bacterium]HPS01048.1 sigma-70 family RNA polymerase sigma factor [Candidatus Sumerlaeota bacterium]